MKGTIVISVLLVAAACGVKKQTHQRVLDQLTATQSELDETRKQRDSCRGDKQALEGDLESAGQTDKEKAARIAKLVDDMKATEQELIDLRKQKEQAEKRLSAFRKLQERFRKLVDTGKLSVDFRNGQMVLKLPSGVLFPSGQAKLSKTGEASLSEILAVLKEFKDRRFMVAGHTDNVPIRSRKFKNNWHLSTARAVSVLEFMLGAGFAGTNLAAAGYGEFDPVAANDTEDGRTQNRRIEIILVPDLSELPNLTSEPS